MRFVMVGLFYKCGSFAPESSVKDNNRLDLYIYDIC